MKFSKYVTEDKAFWEKDWHDRSVDYHNATAKKKNKKNELPKVPDKVKPSFAAYMKTAWARNQM